MVSVARLTELLDECKKELDSVRIIYGNVTSIYINTKRKSAYGTCHKKNKPNGLSQSGNTLTAKYLIYYEIEIMKYLNEKRSEQEIKNTIMHELLHTVAGCFNHSPLWKQYASIVNRKFGYKVQTKTPLTGENLELAKEQREIKWEVVCECCNRKVAEYKRKPTRDFKKMYHPSCGKESLGKFKLIQK